MTTTHFLYQNPLFFHFLVQITLANFLLMILIDIINAQVKLWASNRIIVTNHLIEEALCKDHY